MQEQNINIGPHKNDEANEIQVVDLLKRLWSGKRIVFITAVISAVIGVIVAFSLPKRYTAVVSFAPETEQKTGSGLNSIASMMGVTLDNSVDAISVEMFPDVLASSPFITDLFGLQVRTQNGDLQTDLYDYIINHQRMPWWIYVLEAPQRILFSDEEERTEIPAADTGFVMPNLSKQAREVIRYFNKNLTIEVSKKTGKTTLTLTMQDPLIAATVLESVMNNLKKYMSDYRTSKYSQDVENLQKICDERKQDYYSAQKEYADFADANKNLVLLKAQAEQLKLQQEMNLAYQVYSQVATQLEGARIKEQQSKPVFVILEPVTVPYKKSFPSKSKILILFTFLGGVMAACWVMFADDVINYLKSF